MSRISTRLIGATVWPDGVLDTIEICNIVAPALSPVLSRCSSRSRLFNRVVFSGLRSACVPCEPAVRGCPEPNSSSLFASPPCLYPLFLPLSSSSSSLLRVQDQRSGVELHVSRTARTPSRPSSDHQSGA
eukprot:1866038-Rhodomonas_salina.1